MRSVLRVGAVFAAVFAAVSAAMTAAAAAATGALGLVMAWGLGLGMAPSPVQAQAPAQATRPAAAAPAPAPAASAARAAALQGLSAPGAERRLAAVRRLAEVGTMADVERLARLLRDASEPVRDAAALAMWAVWSRSGDAAIDRRFGEGTRLMGEGDLEPALAVFDEIVKARPAFAEGWNKRATVLFMLGRHAESLQDCDEVLKRNPLHFGALSGMAQIHLRRGDVEQALKAYERALEVNPNLDNAPEVLRLLQEAVRERRGGTGGRST
jgi:tetratricopeptide (TPR) repeat protein